MARHMTWLRCGEQPAVREAACPAGSNKHTNKNCDSKGHILKLAFCCACPASFTPQCHHAALPPPHRCPWLQIVRTGGWGALFSGLEASLIGTTVSQGIYFYL